MSRDLSDWRTTRDVADQHGVQVRDIQHHIKTGSIEASKVGLRGYFYLIHKDDIPKVWPPGSIAPPS